MINQKYADVMKDGRNYWTATDRKDCPHKNGWYITVEFWIFKKRLFVCSDCGEAIKV